jgi:RimJ/RimL family protein N-acetyltransferase
MARVTFEPFGEQHVPHLARWLSDPDVMRFTRIPLPVPEGFAADWLARYEAGRADGTREAFAGIDEHGTMVGLTMAPSIDIVARESELGYLVAPEARGRGLATEMLGMLTRWALEDLGLLRVTLIIDVTNGASLAVARRCGYVQEGTLRSTFVKTGAPRADVTLWSKLASDQG